jgi:1-deoxy-D-xylulose-5-phosphate reductoisomerase
MHLPIQYALSYPERLERGGTALSHPLNWAEVARLDFEDVNLERFPCLRLAFEAGRQGGTAPAVLVGADEQAVALFMRGEMRLTEIAETVEVVLARHTVISEPGLAEVHAAAEWAQDEVLRLRGLPVREQAATTTGSGG